MKNSTAEMVLPGLASCCAPAPTLGDYDHVPERAVMSFANAASLTTSRRCVLHRIVDTAPWQLVVGRFMFEHENHGNGKRRGKKH